MKTKLTAALLLAFTVWTTSSSAQTKTAKPKKAKPTTTQEAPKTEGRAKLDKSTDEKADKGDKTEKGDKTADRAEKSDKASEKSEKGDKAEKKEGDKKKPVEKVENKPQKPLRFDVVEIEGRLKSPQLVYFLRRVRAEFATGELGHRSFLGELMETRKGNEF